MRKWSCSKNPAQWLKYHHQVLELAILSTSISVAPQAVSSSITDAIDSFSTIELIATHSGSSKAVIVGARFPGVIFVAVSRPLRAILYWQRIYFCAARYGELTVLGRGGKGLTDDTVYSRCQHVDELLIRGMFRFDQCCCALDHCVYCFEAGCFHRLSRL